MQPLNLEHQVGGHQLHSWYDYLLSLVNANSFRTYRLYDERSSF